MRSFGSLAVLLIAALAPAAVLGAPPVAQPTGPPPTLYNLDRKIRFVSLAEARAVALEKGKVGQPSLLFDNIQPGVAIPQPEDAASKNNCKVLASDNPGSKSILLTGIPRGPHRAEFERNVNQMLLNIENAYWNLYGSYYQLYSREQGLRFAHETWKCTEAQYRVGQVGQAALAQAEGQYNLFRSQRLQAIDNVLDNERQLRAMMGLPIEDGTRLVPSDAPTLVEKKPDWNEGFRAAMKHRPELRMSRQEVKLAAYKAAMADDVPLGECPQTQLQQAKSQLERARLVLRDQELKAERFLGLYFRRMSSAYFQIKAAREQREAFATQLQVRYELYRAGANEPGTGSPVALNLLLEAQRFWAEALATEYQAIVTYNNALAGWEYAKGDIRKHAHVQIGNEPSSSITGAWREPKPHAPTHYILYDGRCMDRAVECEYKRTRQHVRQEVAVSAQSPLNVLDKGGSGEDEKAPSLPALWKRFPSFKEVGAVQTGLVEDRSRGLN